jgi:hypothetical protein
MIGLRALAVGAMGPDPWPRLQQIVFLTDKDRRVDFAATERFDFDPAALLGDIGDPWTDPARDADVEHTHTGRLCNQFAKQPRASSSRICRGRP